MSFLTSWTSEADGVRYSNYITLIVVLVILSLFLSSHLPALWTTVPESTALAVLGPANPLSLSGVASTIAAGLGLGPGGPGGVGGGGADNIVVDQLLREQQQGQGGRVQGLMPSEMAGATSSSSAAGGEMGGMAGAGVLPFLGAGTPPALMKMPTLNSLPRGPEGGVEKLSVGPLPLDLGAGAIPRPGVGVGTAIYPPPPPPPTDYSAGPPMIPPVDATTPPVLGPNILATFHLTRPPWSSSERSSAPAVPSGAVNSILANPFAPGGSLGPDSLLHPFFRSTSPINLTPRQHDALRGMNDLFPTLLAPTAYNNLEQQFGVQLVENPFVFSPDLEDVAHPLPAILRESLLNPPADRASRGTSGLSLNHVATALKAYLLFTKGGGVADLKAPAPPDLIRKKINTDPLLFRSGLAEDKDLAGGEAWRSGIIVGGDKEAGVAGGAVAEQLWKNALNAAAVAGTGEQPEQHPESAETKNPNVLLTAPANLPWLVGAKEELFSQPACNDNTLPTVLHEALKVAVREDRLQQSTELQTPAELLQPSSQLSPRDLDYLQMVFRKLISPICAGTVDQTLQLTAEERRSNWLQTLLKLYENNRYGVEVGGSIACNVLVDGRGAGAAGPCGKVQARPARFLSFGIKGQNPKIFVNSTDHLQYVARHPRSECVRKRCSMLCCVVTGPRVAVMCSNVLCSVG